MADVERELRALGRVLDVPEAPDLRPEIRDRIVGRAPGPPVAWKRWAVAVVAALTALGLAASPQARAALADMLRFAGVEVHWGAEDPAARPTAPLPGERAVSLAGARAAADFTVGVPARLGPPDRVLVADSARVVSLLYGAGTGRVTVRLDEFDGRLDPVFYKTVSREAEPVDLGPVFGLWLRGPHTVQYVDRAGDVRRETARLAGNTLIWERGGVSYRLEGDLSRAEAVEIAASVR